MFQYNAAVYMEHLSFASDSFTLSHDVSVVVMVGNWLNVLRQVLSNCKSTSFYVYFRFFFSVLQKSVYYLLQVFAPSPFKLQ